MAYYFYKSLMRLLGLLPFWGIALLSRFFTFVAYELIRYRRRVVEEHIALSFADRMEAERQRIIKDFYYHLLYNFLSSPKLLSLSKEELMHKYLKLEGLTLVKALQAKGHKHFVVLMGHCGNWELFSAGQIYFDALGLRQEQLYRPLKNEAFDRVQKEIRMRYGSIATPKSSIGRRMLELMKNKDSEATIFAFIADQTPSRQHVGLWTNFLNRETAFLDGAERLARKFDLPVFYLDIRREGDSAYIGELKLIAEHSKDEAEHSITETYVRMLEQTIKRSPADWLWSHKRWKFTRED